MKDRWRDVSKWVVLSFFDICYDKILVLTQYIRPKNSATSLVYFWLAVHWYVQLFAHKILNSNNLLYIVGLLVWKNSEKFKYNTSCNYSSHDSENSADYYCIWDFWLFFRIHWFAGLYWIDFYRFGLQDQLGGWPSGWSGSLNWGNRDDFCTFARSFEIMKKKCLKKNIFS